MATLCGELEALSVKVSDAERLPAADGEKVSVMPQLAPAPRMEPQLVVMAKSGAFAPLSETLEMLSGPAPVFVKARVTGALDVPTV